MTVAAAHFFRRMSDPSVNHPLVDAFAGTVGNALHAGKQNIVDFESARCDLSTRLPACGVAVGLAITVVVGTNARRALILDVQLQFLRLITFSFAPAAGNIYRSIIKSTAPFQSQS